MKGRLGDLKFPSHRLLGKLPEGDGGCSCHVEGIDLMGHGNEHRVVASANRRFSQAIPLGAQHDSQAIGPSKPRIA